MILKEINITGFKNIAEASLEFSPKVNAFLGDNGMGKSNLLDAIYFMSFCKSFSGMTDRQLIRRGDEFAMVKATYLRHGVDEQLTLGITQERRKSLKRQGKEYQRLSSHIGAFPLVMSSPADADIIRGAADERRRLMDMVISQTDPIYLDALIRYNHSLEQRNRMLRDGCSDMSLYAVVEIQMELAAQAIHQARSAWTERLTAIFSRYYAAIAGPGEEVTLSYASALNEPGTTLTALLDASRRRDEAVRHTTVGPHRDDLEMMLDGMAVRRAASQGQCKTYAIALRLAQYEFLRDAVGMRPLLLLDDIFDKLDASRVERIMELVTDAGFGQIFITDTNRTHLDEIMRRTGGDYALWRVEQGRFER